VSRIEAEYQGSTTVGRQQETVWEVVSDIERHGEYMPDVKKFERTEDGWRWVFEPTRRLGFRFQPKFTVAYEEEPPDRLEFRKVPRDGDSADADGRIELEEVDDGTRIEVRLDLSLDLPVPSMLRGRARSMLDDELDRLGSGLLQNLASAAEDASAD
jgi:carbon monoxide dehydrogenase subunit G